MNTTLDNAIEKETASYHDSKLAKRINGIESTAIVTGRAENYHGETVPDLIKKVMDKAYLIGLKENCIAMDDWFKLELGKESSEILQIVKQVGQKQLLEAILVKTSNWGNGTPMISGEEIMEIAQGMGIELQNENT